MKTIEDLVTEILGLAGVESLHAAKEQAITRRIAQWVEEQGDVRHYLKGACQAAECAYGDTETLADNLYDLRARIEGLVSERDLLRGILVEQGKRP